MAKKEFSDNLDELFARHDKAKDKEVEKENKDQGENEDKATAPPEERQERQLEENAPHKTENKDQPVVANTQAKKKSAPKRSLPAKKATTTTPAVRELSEEQLVFINRTYSISRKIVNAITDYAYHNKVDKNTIVNTALKEFLGNYYDEAES